MHGAAERCVVVLPADWIDVGTARDQELGDIDAVVVRRDVERALALGTFDVGRGAEIEQEPGGADLVVLCSREERLRRAEKLRMLRDLRRIASVPI